MSDFSQMAEDIRAGVDSFLREREYDDAGLGRVVRAYRATGIIWAPEDLEPLPADEIGGGG